LSVNRLDVFLYTQIGVKFLHISLAKLTIQSSGSVDNFVNTKSKIDVLFPNNFGDSPLFHTSIPLLYFLKYIPSSLTLLYTS
ncbi:hypothetical protein, partial [Clostridioides difficile]|uniref:hypothetical protein n=1 Tax=Clostridioides difficile TaxID=1496 RepID=UPI00197BC2B1